MQLIPPWVKLTPKTITLLHLLPLLLLLLLLLPQTEVEVIIMVQPSIQGITRRSITTHQTQWTLMRPPSGINGSMRPDSTASGTLTLGAPPFLLGWPSLPSVGSSKARIHCSLSAPMTLLPLLPLMMATNLLPEWCNNSCDSVGAFPLLGEFLSGLMKLGVWRFNFIIWWFIFWGLQWCFLWFGFVFYILLPLCHLMVLFFLFYCP